MQTHVDRRGSLLKKSHKTGTNCPATRQRRPRSSRTCGGHCAQSGQAKKASVSSLDFAWNCHSLFKCTQKNNAPWSPAHMLQTILAVVWSQSYLRSHSLINNLIVCNKSCYCSIINRKLNNKCKIPPAIYKHHPELYINTTPYSMV